MYSDAFAHSKRKGNTWIITANVLLRGILGFQKDEVR
jgi:hypothetical protein